MEIIVDTQFIVMYLLKAINIGIAYLSLYLSGQFFSEMYMKQVYALNKPAPTLYQFIGLFVMFFLAFNMFLLTLLMLILYIFKSPNNNFSINWFLIQLFIKDMFFMLIFFLLFSFIVASLIQKKKYFRFKTEGLRAIRGIREILFYFAIIIFIMPYFYFL